MRDWRGQLDMTHAVASDFGERDLHATFFANDAAVLHTLVLAAQALVILDRSEDSSAKQAVAFGFERPVVDRLRLLYLAERPGVNPLGTGDRDADLVKALSAADLPKDIHQFVHQRPLHWSVVMSEVAGIRAAGTVLAAPNPRCREGNPYFLRGGLRSVAALL